MLLTKWPTEKAMHLVNGAKATVKEAIRALGKFASNSAARSLSQFLNDEVFFEPNDSVKRAKPARKQATSKVDKQAQIATVREKWVAAHGLKDEASKHDCLDAAKQLPPASLRELLAWTLSPPDTSAASASSMTDAKRQDNGAEMASKQSPPNRSSVLVKRTSSAIAEVNAIGSRKVCDL